MRGYKRNKFSKRKQRIKHTTRIRFQLHPLFIAVGILYSFTGDLPLFLLSCLVAIQHECAHAFAAAKLGYALNKIVLMPFGAVIDGDLKQISLKDESFVAICGPLCNLATAFFFAALWWFEPTMYAFTDTAYYASLAIASVNLLPAYPLDGGRILKCFLENLLRKSERFSTQAEQKSHALARAITLLFSLGFLLAFCLLLSRKIFNFSLLAFSLFLLFGAIGNKERAQYDKLNFSISNALSRGIELRHVAVLDTCPIKNALKYISRGTYLILEVYDENECRLFELPQNTLSEYFLFAQTPYETLQTLRERFIHGEQMRKNV